jgi:hypothetical protein
VLFAVLANEAFGAWRGRAVAAAPPGAKRRRATAAL